MIDDKECSLLLSHFSHFFIMADDYIYTNFQASLLTSECCLFAPKDVLGCSNGSNQMSDHNGICWKVVLALFEDFVCHVAVMTKTWPLYQNSKLPYKESLIEGFFFLPLTLKEKGCQHLKNLIQFLVCLNWKYIYIIKQLLNKLTNQKRFLSH